MAKRTQDRTPRTEKVVFELAFEGDAPPPSLSKAIVSLVELCQIAMPYPNKVRQNIEGAGFFKGEQEIADGYGAAFALDDKVVSWPIRSIRHEIYGRARDNEPVILLLSEAESGKGKVVFLSALFRGAMEADAVKAAAHVAKRQPFTGAIAKNAAGNTLRRVFWDVEGEGNIRGLMVSGPENVESTTLPRAFTAFALAK